METREWTHVDKATWGDGPWQSEPDKRQWIDEATGLPCLIVRGPSGGLCGYVGVARSHPDYGRGYDDVEVEVHGGLTFANKCQPNAERGICHVVAEGEDDDVWWLGFDCAHSGDQTPAYDWRWRELRREWETYKAIGYVEAETRRLAAQLKARS